MLIKAHEVRKGMILEFGPDDRVKVVRVYDFPEDNEVQIYFEDETDMLCGYHWEMEVEQ